MLRLFAFAYLAVIIIPAGFTAAQTTEPAAQLLLPSRHLQPTSTFEVRFAAEMVPADQTRQSERVAARFRAGAERPVYVVEHTQRLVRAGESFPLGTKVKISLRRGLKDATGREIAAKLNETAETPPMRMRGSSALGRSESDNATATPRYLLLFNTNVDAAAAARIYLVGRFLRQTQFRQRWSRPMKRKTKSIVSMPGGVTIIRSRPGRKVSMPGSRWKNPKTKGTRKRSRPKPAKKIEPRRNVLFVTAEKPLPPGKDWQLVLEAGLPSAEWKIGLPERKTVNLGSVQPFIVKEVVAETNRNEGAASFSNFSKTLATKVTSENAKQWILVAPAVSNLRVEVEGDAVTWRGDFALATPYRVTVNVGLPASEAVHDPATIFANSHVRKVAPRLYFEDFATHQLLNGTRRFRLLSINVPRLRVTAKLFTGAEIRARPR